ELSVVCPVCREPLSYDASTLLLSPAPDFPQQEDGAVGADFKRKWESLQKILERQKEKGGVIDPEAESNRFLIHINDVPPDSDSTCPDTTNPEPSQPLPSAHLDCPSKAPVPQAQNISATSQRRAPHGRRPQVDFRGGRRGRGKGGGRSGQLSHGTPPHVEQNLAKLSVSASESDHGLLKNCLLPQNNDPHAESTEVEQSLQPKVTDKDQTSLPGKQTGEEYFATSQQDTLGDAHEQQIRQSNSIASEDAAQTIVTDGQQDQGPRERGRRYGPRAPQYGQWHERTPRGSSQWDSAGRAHHHHRGGRAHRARGGGFSHHYRGGGPYRGTGKGMHPKTETEFKKEGVL
ncbi:hypothetical protein NFI96_022825, partial [Prochilodus magdalenae]